MTFSAPIHETDFPQGVCIVGPSDDPYRAEAERLKHSLEGTLVTHGDVLSDGDDDIGGRHVIVLGNMMDRAFLRTLYFRVYDLTDRVWPSLGGWAVRTVPHSLEEVEHVIVVGVSLARTSPMRRRQRPGAPVPRVQPAGCSRVFQ